MRLATPALLIGFLWSCRPSTRSAEDLNTAVVRFPNGKEILAERMVNPLDMARGMMYRDSLPPDRGMLFIHDKPAKHAYWMYQVRIPLDLIWLDEDRRIVDIAPDAPPCRTKASECPTYGGREVAKYVLELAGGEAGRNGLIVGQTLAF